MKKQAHPYLLLIQTALSKIQEYKPESKTDFLDNQMVQDAIIMRLQEVGENLVHIRDKTPGFYQANASADWSKIIGLRNIISHGYHSIDAEQIWEVLVEHLPPFADTIAGLINNENQKVT
jgi:uncharacterized protein with HEPN domain